MCSTKLKMTRSTNTLIKWIILIPLYRSLSLILAPLLLLLLVLCPTVSSLPSPSPSPLPEPSPMVGHRQAAVGRAPRTLYTAGFFPLNHKIPEGAIGRGVMPAVNLALKHINADPTILSGYTLDIVPKDTECDPAVGMKALFDMIHGDPKKLILFGDACTSVTDPIAKASKFFNLIQLSYADTHPMYTSESYPNFYRVVPSEAAFNPARLALLQRFNWTKVGTLYENHPRFSLPHSKLLTDLDEVNIKFKFTQSISEDIQLGIEKLKAESVRIILGNFGEDFARKIFCEAYKHGLYGRKYQWIIAGVNRDLWWETEEENFECTKEELLQALEGYIAMDVLTLSSSKEVTVSGLTASQYEEEYNLKRDQEYSKFHGYAYDGMWTIAFALENVMKKLSERQPETRIEHFDYKNLGSIKWADLFREALNETFFTGVTGNVSFDGNERRGSILLKQFQDGREVKIGEYHSTTDVLDLDVGEPISWRGGSGPPVDEIIKITVASRISLTLFIVISVFAVMGIILALVFLSMNIKYRKQRYIKMSSPYLNNLIIIGCILTYTSVILLGLDSRLLSEANFPYICAARSWVLMSGFTLAFGSMFSKTWRVHAIFTNIKLNKKVIKDYKLFMVVGILVFIDVATLTTWQIVDPFYRGTHQGIPKPSPENEDVHIVPQMEFCDSKRMTIFLGSIYVYKGLLMAFGCFLAWETRHVSIPALNDSKYIGMSVYNVVIMCVIGAGLSFVLKEQQDAAFVIISIFIIFCSTATLCLVFVPKLIELKRNPDMDERRSRPTLKPLKKSRKESDEMELHQRIKVLTEFNTRQRQRLKEKTFELEALMFRLRQYGIEMGTTNDDLIKPKDPVQPVNPVASSNNGSGTGLTSTSTGKPTSLSPEIRALSVDKHICLLITEKESSTLTKSEKDTSFISLSASMSLVSGSVDELVPNTDRSHPGHHHHHHQRTSTKPPHTSCPELPKGDELLKPKDVNNSVRRRKLSPIETDASFTAIKDPDDNNRLSKPSTSSTPSDLVKEDYSFHEFSDDAGADEDEEEEDDNKMKKVNIALINKSNGYSGEDNLGPKSARTEINNKSIILKANAAGIGSAACLPVDPTKSTTINLSNNGINNSNNNKNNSNKVIVSLTSTCGPSLICDETSYSMAIKASLNDNNNNNQGYNGFCSSCEEDDTEKCDQTMTLSEESDQSLKPDFNPRRTQSLSAISYRPETGRGGRGEDSKDGPSVSLVDNGTVSLSKGTLLVHPIFPFLSQMTCPKNAANPVNNNNNKKGSTRAKSVTNTNAAANSSYQNIAPYWPIFSSYPSIKCDIVEYL